MGSSNNTVSDPASLSEARTLWARFTTFMKYSTVAVAAILILMLIALY